MLGWRQSSHTLIASDPFLRAVRARLEPVSAPEALRLRIGIMLAGESARVAGEPEDRWSR